MKLEFTFDANLAAPLSADKPAVESMADGSGHSEPPPPITMPPGTMMHRGTAVVAAAASAVAGVGTVQDQILPLQSPAADDLNLKIMSVKNVWEPDAKNRLALAEIFEQRSVSWC